jgi:tRNA pseudouridine55 synthase
MLVEGIPVFDKSNICELKNNLELYPNGIIVLIDKPYKWTSADAVRKVKFLSQRFFHKKWVKIGHAGTLDPLATGLLILCIGNATKKAELLQCGDKEYIAEIEFGATTPSFDLEKEIDNRYPFEHITQESLNAALNKFIGEQEQIPPKFSAKMIGGVRAYEMARAGEEVEMRPSKIRIDLIEVLEYRLPSITVKINCGKGTYIRSFARDLGAELSSGAHLTNLIRTKSGNFTLENAAPLLDFVEVLEA